MNILIDLLPTKVEIDSKEYEINSNFRTSLLFSLLMEDDDVGEEQKIIQALNPFNASIKLSFVIKSRWLVGSSRIKIS